MRKAQITIFMIVGLIILFIFLFLLQLGSSLKKGQLQTEKEQLTSKLFQKEAMRIYVEDCLSDELEKGLILIGRQGKIWYDQPGGTKAFEEEISGRTYRAGERLGLFSTGRVAYSITREEYFQHPNAYPCDVENNSPSFCQYNYPNTELGFGSLQLRSRVLERDLERYLLNRTIACVEEFVLTNISGSVELEPSPIELEVSIQDEGISVSTNYPLRFRIGEEEFFHLSRFDFFYRTRFKQLIETAATFPLQWDQKYVDFNYTPETLEQYQFSYGNEQESRDCVPFEDYFLCNRSLGYDAYRSLSLDMEKEELSNGDDIFLFTPALLTIITSKPFPYQLRIARQNRPPALDYVNRSACFPEYDYLVIQDDEEFGEIDLNLFSLDPDEDIVQYSFPPADLFSEVVPSENQFYLSNESVHSLSPGTYTVIANTTDEHGLSDWQEVQVLVDRPLNTTLFLHMPYTLRLGDSIRPYNDIFAAADRFWVSSEDPVFLNVSLPEESLVSGFATVHLNYTYPEQIVPTPISLETAYSQGRKDFCFNLPWDEGARANCNLDDYVDFIDDWPNQGFDFNLFSDFTDDGELRLDFGYNYCGNNEQYSSNVARVRVVQCVPHNNPEYPNPYIPETDFYKQKFEPNGNTGEYEFLEIDDEVSPFQGRHACCNNDWTIKDPGEECFSTGLSCEGGYQGYPDGYILQETVWTCDGTRGNVCGAGNPDGEISLFGGELRCGDPNQNSNCDNIDPQCEGALSWGFQNNGWCNKKMGCEGFCQEPVVAKSGSGISQGDFYDMNEIALQQPLQVQQNEDLFVDCGCSGNNGDPCDGNFDGTFEGVCQPDGSCQ